MAKSKKKLGLCWHFRDLKLKATDFKFSTERLHIEVIYLTKFETSWTLTFPMYRRNYVKNVEIGSLGWVLMIVIHRLNIY